MSKLAIKDIYPTTSMQKSIMFHSLMNTEDYKVKIELELDGQVNVQALQKSFQELVSRYDIFRTIFPRKKVKESVQVVLQSREVALGYVDLSEGDDKSQIQKINEYWNENSTFQLEKDILVKMALFKLNKKEYSLQICFHHIIMDGWCLELFLKEIFELYHSFVEEKDIIQRRPKQYKEYINWLRAQNMEEAALYWGNYVEGYEKEIILPHLGVTEAYSQQIEEMIFEKEALEKMTQLARENNLTLNTIVQVAWGIVLQKYTNADDVIFGSVVSGRNVPVDDVEKIMGLFINTLPTRIKTEKKETILQLLIKLQRENNRSKEYEYYSLSDIQEKTILKNKLIHHIMAFENYEFELENINQNNELKVKNLQSVERSNYPLNLLVYPGENLVMKFVYNSHVYEQRFIQRLKESLYKVLRGMLDNVEQPVEEIEIVGEIDNQRIQEEFNQTENGAPIREETVQKYILRRMQEAGDSPALSSNGMSYSYNELNRKTNQIGRYIRSKGVQPNGVVGILMKRTAKAPLAILGVLKAGAAYLPIDATLPKERAEYMLKDSGVNLLITDRELESGFNFQGEVINIDDEFISQECDEAIEVLSSKEDLSYVIYTSGTTGRPKGVGVRNQSLLNTAEETHIRLGERAGGVLSTASISFDMFTMELFIAIAGKQELVIADEEQRMDNILLCDLIEKKDIVTLCMTPSRIESIVHDRRCTNALKKIKVIKFGGEVLQDSTVKRLQEKTNARIFNGYGPTEVTIYCTLQEIKKGEKVTIGKPISNMQVFILDKNQNVMPIGVPGEICVGGIGVAKGYLGNEDLTNQKFVDMRHVTKGKLYKTGDLGRWTETGELEYLGRVDEQVKIRGYRVELEEIESQIKNLNGINQCAVLGITYEGSVTKSLVAFVTSKLEVEEDKMKKNLLKSLPEYMIPSRILCVDHIPITTNGKVNKKALEGIAKEKLHVSAYKKAVSEVQKEIEEVWRELLFIENISIEQSFFEIGGNSILAMMLSSRLSEKFNKNISVKDIFTNDTIAKLERVIVENAKGNISKAALIENVGKKEYYPVSSAEKRIYLLDQYENGKAYNLIKAFNIYGQLDVLKLKKSIQKLIGIHENLKGSFKFIEENLVKVLNEENLVEVKHYTMTENELFEQSEFLIEDFDLSTGPLVKPVLIEMKDTEYQYVLILNFHHIIVDGRSLETITNDLFKLYNDEEIEASRVRYVDYASWENEWKETKEEEERFWIESLRDTPSNIELATDYRRPVVKKFTGNTLEFKVDDEIFSNLKVVAKQEKVTLYMLLISAYNLLLSKYTGKEDIVLGTVVNGRTSKELETTVGMFVNTLALRSFPKRDLTFKEYIAAFKKICIEAFNHQAYPFDELVEKLQLDSNPSKNPLFDYLFILQEGENEVIKTNGLRVENSTNKFLPNVSKFDITLEAIQEEVGLVLQVNYDTCLFKEETIQSIVNNYIHILKHVNAVLEQEIKHIEVVEEKEKKDILFGFNQLEIDDFEEERTIQKYIGRKLHSGNDKNALYVKGVAYTFAELDKRSNQVARCLRKKGIRSNDVVALVMERSVDVIVGILGILKAGGAYLPIDGETPRERIEYILKDSETVLVMTQKKFQEKFQYDRDIVTLDEMYMESHADLEIMSDSNDTAYVIYTSGTTGKPKGAMVKNISLLNIVKDAVEQAEVDKQTGALLSMTSIAFDMFTIEVFLALGLNEEFIFTDERERMDNEVITQLINDRNVNTMWMTPSRVTTFLQGEESIRILQKLKRIYLAGEAIKEGVLKDVLELTDARIFNIYGPTETTIYCTSKEFREDGPDLTIGRPVKNVQIYILDKNLNIVPIGVPGEICIGGIGVSKGYLNNKDLTNEKFIENPFKPGEKMYKSGDLGSWTLDGQIKYLGRIDQQVKIRGYRIELGEIETNIRGLKDVSDCAVLAIERENGNTFLSAYIVGDVDSKDVQRALEKNLPGYMIPEYITKIDKMPITLNGKIDKKKLKEVKIQEDIKEYKEPINAIQEEILKIWKKILGVEVISIDESFFSLGGDSIKAIQIVGLMRKAGMNITVKDILSSGNIEELSLKTSLDERKKEHIDCGKVEGEVPLGAIQKFFLENNEEINSNFNQSLLLHRAGGLKEQLVKQAFNLLVRQHPTLRMQYEKVEDIYTQTIRPFEEDIFLMQTYDYHELDVKRYIEEKGEEIQKSIDVENNKLVNLSLFKGRAGDFLLIVIHHFIVDGVSWRIIVEDFENIYESLVQGKEIEFVPQTTSIQTWMMELEKYADSRMLEKEVGYWREIEKEESVIKFKDRTNVNKCMKEIEEVERKLTKAETKILINDVNKTYSTEINDVLLTALALTLTNGKAEDKVLINLEGHGREEVIENLDLTRTVGWFTAIYPVLLEVQKDRNLTYNMRAIKERLRGIPNKGVGYGILKYMTSQQLKDSYDLQFNQHPEISFNYLGEIKSMDGEQYQILNFKRGSEIADDVNLNIDIAINSVIIEGELNISVAYDRIEYKKEDMIRFIERFVDYLREIMKGCQSQEEVELTPSDFGMDQMSLDKFDEIMDFIDDNLSLADKK
ncbi:non-ribosomal peptide synthetase [Bacillus gaemokensis]|uniref:Carrier domain-containing protein n=1 Tax=Bacillus gaemokensis TaxID=574375 RepID=A0A073KFS9_9BACI|nr:non-ribosomal peptide synthetase [Bacillus gaemokensis]KEK25307.1 hypothetical protein BAGA_11805 [Bacillus gaemokensis]KYG37249.1 hypothetical protein AZF08_07535 [Bacillus gaemokensis]